LPPRSGLEAFALSLFLVGVEDSGRPAEEEAYLPSELAARHPDRARRPPLFGVALGVKDAFHVDGLPTRAGSRLPPEVLQGPEGPCVAALRQAGALVVGKTVTTEFTYFAPGPTRNPRNPKHTPGGSSSGSAAAVAAGLVPLALGTQTIGSITRPAAFCGVVGFKASYGRISRDGVIPLAPSLDQVGFFTAGVDGAARVAPLLVREWRHAHPEGRPVLGVPEGPYLESASPEGLAHFREVCRRLTADAEWFRLEASVEAREGGAPFCERKWDEKISRDLL
jgi:Asp-tRNA(Asn)/Glu-tRNA(Gln) amidotransferase A subunit family amidase